MMFRPCEYELIPPRHTQRELDTDPHANSGVGEPADARWSHPDPKVTARAMTLSRSSWARRFVFFESLRTNDVHDNRPAVFPSFYGFRNAGDGSVVVLKHGQPYGWYSSIASAWRRLTTGSGLWLAWLEPDPSMPTTSLIGAELEASRGPASTWYLTVPLTAHGLAEARQRCLDVTFQLQTCIPGLDRLDVTVRHGGEPDTETHVFCESPGCLQPPMHAGDHQPPPEPGSVGTGSYSASDVSSQDASHSEME